MAKAFEKIKSKQNDSCLMAACSVGHKLRPIHVNKQEMQ